MTENPYPKLWFMLVVVGLTMNSAVASCARSGDIDPASFDEFELVSSQSSHLFAKCIKLANSVSGTLTGYPLASGNTFTEFEVPEGARAIDWKPVPEATTRLTCAEVADAEESLMFSFGPIGGCQLSGRQIYDTSAPVRRSSLASRQSAAPVTVYVSSIHTCNDNGFGYLVGEELTGGPCPLVCTDSGFAPPDAAPFVPETCCILYSGDDNVVPCLFYSSFNAGPVDYLNLPTASMCDAEHACKTLSLELADVKNDERKFLADAIVPAETNIVRVNVRSDNALVWRSYPSGVVVTVEEAAAAANECAAYFKDSETFHKVDCIEPLHYICIEAEKLLPDCNTSK